MAVPKILTDVAADVRIYVQQALHRRFEQLSDDELQEYVDWVDGRAPEEVASAITQAIAEPRAEIVH